MPNKKSLATTTKIENWTITFNHLPTFSFSFSFITKPIDFVCNGWLIKSLILVQKEFRCKWDTIYEDLMIDDTFSYCYNDAPFWNISFFFIWNVSFRLCWTTRKTFKRKILLILKCIFFIRTKFKTFQLSSVFFYNGYFDIRC